MSISPGYHRSMRELTFELNGQSTRVLDAGGGWPVVLLHAFPLNADMWRRQLELVPQGWRFLAPDLRGFGPSRPETLDALTMAEYASDVGALLDALELERAWVGGLSMGGYVSFEVLRRMPERLYGLLLADTRPQADTSEGRQGRRAASELVNAKGLSALADQMIPKLLGATSRRERSVDRDVRRIIESNSVAAVDAAIHAMMLRPDSTPDLARITHPTLILVGDEDELTPRAESDLMQREIRRSQLVVLPGAGHLSSLEVPELFSAALENFLTSSI
jgi:pimeloyl-ACP methyl ester carboxylesterase